MTSHLTLLQQAYLLGRNTQWPQSGVSMHDFRLFQSKLLANPEKGDLIPDT
ncbi:TPA: hypothetical protein ACW0I5_004357 [Escherichia coli]